MKRREVTANFWNRWKQDSGAIIGEATDGEFRLGRGELRVSVQHPNRHFQEVIGYAGLKLWSEFMSADRCDGTGVC